MTDTHHPAFELLQSESIASLNLQVQSYRHKKTGALHYHMATNNPENVFLVGLRTVPTDSTGVAHILEHTALCGSKNYPVRDPFFMMLRRSLNTFMNAFTSSDWTAYPFASQNKKDFNNLLDVYLDAVFFSRLDPLDFAQEGHRVEFAKADDPNSELVFKGVVFNEMKGAMSSPASQLWHTLCEHLYPNTTYHYNSGGEPENIPDLTYDELQTFYRRHYHPSNATFMTYGDIPVIEHQTKFEEHVLAQFDRLDDSIRVNDVTRYQSPINAESHYPIEQAEMADDKSHIVLAWLLGRNVDHAELLKAHLLSSVLLDNSASPLLQALETTQLGSAPSPLCGLEDSNREMAFVCGLEGSKTTDAQATEDLILSVLNEVAEKGVSQEKLEAVLHQMELGQREIGGSSYPYGLQLILRALPAAIHGGDPIAMLNLDPALQQLREEIKDPAFIKNLVRDNLLDNPHRVRLVLEPDSELAQQRIQAEKQRLATIKAGLSDEEQIAIVKQAAALEVRQQQKDDPEVLPKVGLGDVPTELQTAEGQSDSVNNMPFHFYAQGTNGLMYQDLVIDLPNLDDELLSVLPYYTNLLVELGCGDQDYLAMQSRQYEVSGGIAMSARIRAGINDVQQLTGKIIFAGKALLRNQSQLTELMQFTLDGVRFDEHARIREIISQSRAQAEQSITGDGHSLAMQAAASQMSAKAALTHRLHGLGGIKAIKSLDTTLKTDAAIQAFSDKLQRLHKIVLTAPRQFLIVAEQEARQPIQDVMTKQWQATESNNGFNAFSQAPVRGTAKHLWVTSTQVNFCAKSYATVPVEHPDAAALTVLGGFMRNGYLHTAIREQGGAYGGGASYDADIAAFNFFSYRDPRMLETLNDFDRAIDFVMQNKHDDRQVEEAILGVISKIDKPSSPSGEARKAFYNDLFGRSKEQRQRYRGKILQVTLDDLRRVTETYLTPSKASVAIVTNASAKAAADELELDEFNL